VSIVKKPERSGPKKTGLKIYRAEYNHYEETSSMPILENFRTQIRNGQFSWGGGGENPHHDESLLMEEQFRQYTHTSTKNTMRS
jgi:hypothetical protein